MPTADLHASDRPRVREVASPTLHVVRGLYLTLLGLTLGSITTFLGVVVLAIVVEETRLVDALGLGLDFDALFRASMMPVLISGGVMALAWPAVVLTEKYAMFIAVQELAGQHPGSVPPKAVRDMFDTTPAENWRTAGTIICWIAGALVVLFIAMTIYMAGESRDSFLLSLVMLACSAVPVAIGYLLIVGARRAEPEQAVQLAELRTAWKSWARRVDGVDAKIRATLPKAELPRMLRTEPRGGLLVSVLGWIAGLGTAIFMIGLLLRKPCRTCDEQVLNTAGESLIDSAAVIGGGLLTVFGLLSVCVWLFAVGRRIFTESALRRWLAAGERRRVDDRDRIVELLGSDSATSRLTVTLASFGAAVLIIAGGIALTDWEGVDPSIALVVGQGLLFAAVLLGVFSAPREVALRALIRDRLVPGDLPSPAELARRNKHAATRDERRASKRGRSGRR